MIDYRPLPDSNIVEITVTGDVTEADLSQVVAQLEQDMATHGKLRLLEEVQNFQGIDPMALWKDAQFSLAHLQDFSYVAVVADAPWLLAMADAVSNVLPCQVKTFSPTEVESAREWLRTAPEPGASSPLEYRSTPDSNIVEITVAGTITAADFEQLVAQMKPDFERHGKLRILEEIRSFEGIDPLALLKDIQFALPRIGDIERIAVVTDTNWILTMTTALANVVPAQVKAFDHLGLEDARAWLAQV